MWSSDASVTHSPPTDFVMKNQKWLTADTMTSVLLNNNGEVSIYASNYLKKCKCVCTCKVYIALLNAVYRVGIYFVAVHYC